jgi:DNA-binding transcriptional LysR family regulator
VFPLAAAFHADCLARGAVPTRLSFSREVLGGAWDALAEKRADLVLGAAGDPPPGGGYRLRLMAEAALIFAVAPGHPLATADAPLSEARIAAHRAVVATDTSRRLAPRSVGLLAGQDTLSVPDIETKLAAQIAGLGCGFLPAFLAAPAIAAGQLVEKAVEQPRLPVRLQLAWRELRPGNALSWWIAAIERADWRFLALGPMRPPSSRTKGARRAGRRGVTSET